MHFYVPILQAKFTNVALPKSVICYVAFPCDVPFTVTKSMFNKYVNRLYCGLIYKKIDT